MINFGSAGQFVSRDGKRLTFKYDATDDELQIEGIVLSGESIRHGLVNCQPLDGSAWEACRAYVRDFLEHYFFDPYSIDPPLLVPDWYATLANRTGNFIAWNKKTLGIAMLLEVFASRDRQALIDFILEMLAILTPEKMGRSEGNS